MILIADISAPVPPVSPETTGDEIYRRFELEPDLLGIAVIDADRRPVGLIERNAFFLRMAAEYGRALYARRPIATLMDTEPLRVEADTPVAAFTGEALATRPSQLFKGFIVLRDSRYHGVGSVLSLLQHATDENARRARELEIAERDAQTAHARVRDAVDAMPEGVAFFDEEDRYVLWNRRYAEIHAASSDVLRPGLPFRDVLTHGLARGQYPDAAVDPQAWLASRLARLDQPVSTEEQALADGRWVRIEEHRLPSGGRISAAVDITDMKRRELDLRRTQVFLDAVVDSVPSVLVVKEPVSGRYVLVNRAAEALLGMPRQQLLGLTDDDIFPVEQAAQFALTDAAVIEDPTLQVGEEQTVVTRALGLRHLHTTKRSMPAAAPGGAPHILLVCDDITERKQAAEALRTALDAAQAADRSKSEFLANMSHEIRTPLNGVLGLASVLAEADLKPRHREIARTIAASAVTLERLLSDVLDLARIESGKMEIQPEPVDLEPLISRCAALFQGLAEQKSLGFRLSMSPAAQGRFETDPVRLEQILNNLLANAIKFTASGHVALLTEVEETAAGPVHRFDVCDTGIGFDAKAHAGLFGRFNQADGSITRRFGGSGLGLAIARDLAERMGGELTAVSRPGQGSVFTLRLPLTVAAAPEPAAVIDAQPIDAQVRILVADDHPVNLDVVRLILASAGVEAVLTTDGAQALAAFQAERFDAALIDLQMPVMDGLTAIRRMRAFEASRGRGRTPILALTANALPEHKAASAAAGADGHLSKPIVAARLLAALQDALATAPEHRLSA